MHRENKQIVVNAALYMGEEEIKQELQGKEMHQVETTQLEFVLISDLNTKRRKHR